MRSLRSGIGALAIAALAGCVEDSSGPGGSKRDARQPANPDSAQITAGSRDAEASTGFGLVVPTEADMIRLRTALAAQKLGRITAMADNFILGYHGATPYANTEERELDEEFLQAFFKGRYDRIGEFKQRFGALIPQDDPGAASAVALARMGFLNIWEFSERYRMLPAPGPFAPEVQQGLGISAGACAQYFQAAVAAAPNNAVYRGFAADCTLFLGQGPDGPANTLKGLTLAADAIRRNPEFNLFTIGYALSAMPPGSQEFELGLEMLWRDLDVCFDTTFDRDNPSVAKYMASFTPTNNNKYCVNTEKSAHNFEGFSLIFGDLLLKANRPAVAKIAYENAMLLPSYKTWPYRHKLEERLSALEQLITPFSMPVDPMAKPAYPTVTFHTEYACMACHQKE